jgi:predicted RNA binding protein YcfA (HicA-like mRNA interferase family)
LTPHFDQGILSQVGKHDKVLQQILSGRADHNIAYADLVSLLQRLGFTHRPGKGSHRVFTRTSVIERITLQPDGAIAKHYQVRQVRSILTRYALHLDEQT